MLEGLPLAAKSLLLLLPPLLLRGLLGVELLELVPSAWSTGTRELYTAPNCSQRSAVAAEVAAAVGTSLLLPSSSAPHLARSPRAITRFTTCTPHAYITAGARQRGVCLEVKALARWRRRRPCEVVNLSALNPFPA